MLFAVRRRNRDGARRTGNGNARFRLVNARGIVEHELGERNHVARHRAGTDGAEGRFRTLDVRATNGNRLACRAAALGREHDFVFGVLCGRERKTHQRNTSVAAVRDNDIDGRVEDGFALSDLRFRQNDGRAEIGEVIVAVRHIGKVRTLVRENDFGLTRTAEHCARNDHCERRDQQYKRFSLFHNISLRKWVISADPERSDYPREPVCTRP